MSNVNTVGEDPLKYMFLVLDIDVEIVENSSGIDEEDERDIETCEA